MKKSIILFCLPLFALTSCGAKTLTQEEANAKYLAMKAKPQKVDLTKSYKFSIKISEGVQSIEYESSIDTKGNYSVIAKMNVQVESLEMKTSFNGVCLKTENSCYLNVKAAGLDGKFKFPFENDITGQVGSFDWDSMIEGFLSTTDEITSTLTGKTSGSKTTLGLVSKDGDISITLEDDLIIKASLIQKEAKTEVSLDYLNKLTISVPSDASSYTTPPTPPASN